MSVRVSQSFSSLQFGLRWQPSACLWFLGPRDGGGSHKVRVLAEVIPLMEDQHCGKEQGRDEKMDTDLSSAKCWIGCVFAASFVVGI